MFDIEYNLATVAAEIATASSSIAILNQKLGNQYLIGNVDEATLLALGFTYVGLSNITEYPYYIKSNIIATYEASVLNVSEMTVR